MTPHDLHLDVDAVEDRVLSELQDAAQREGLHCKATVTSTYGYLMSGRILFCDRDMEYNHARYASTLIQEPPRLKWIQTLNLGNARAEWIWTLVRLWSSSGVAAALAVRGIPSKAVAEFADDAVISQLRSAGYRVSITPATTASAPAPGAGATHDLRLSVSGAPAAGELTYEYAALVLIREAPAPVARRNPRA